MRGVAETGRGRAGLLEAEAWPGRQVQHRHRTHVPRQVQRKSAVRGSVHPMTSVDVQEMLGCTAQALLA